MASVKLHHMACCLPWGFTHHPAAHASAHSSAHASAHSSTHASAHSSAHASAYSSTHASTHASAHASAHALPCYLPIYASAVYCPPRADDGADASMVETAARKAKVLPPVWMTEATTNAFVVSHRFVPSHVFVMSHSSWRRLAWRCPVILAARDIYYLIYFENMNVLMLCLTTME